MTGLHPAVLQYSTVIATQHGHRMTVCNNLRISSCMPHESDHVTLQLVTVELRFARSICTRIGVCAEGDEKVNVYDKAQWRPKAS
jgi:ABC-type polar amino acid transport system ATPase subunit